MVRELKSCPFCGTSDIDIHSRKGTYTHHFTCTGCALAIVIAAGTVENAITAWNTRHNEPSAEDRAIVVAVREWYSTHPDHVVFSAALFEQLAQILQVERS